MRAVCRRFAGIAGAVRRTGEPGMPRVEGRCLMGSGRRGFGSLLPAAADRPRGAANAAAGAPRARAPTVA